VVVTDGDAVAVLEGLLEGVTVVVWEGVPVTVPLGVLVGDCVAVTREAGNGETCSFDACVNQQEGESFGGGEVRRDGVGVWGGWRSVGVRWDPPGQPQNQPSHCEDLAHTTDWPKTRLATINDSGYVLD
jgi:hypothetical protein